MHESAVMTPLREPMILGRVRRYRIVVGVDLSEYADIVIEHALDQAGRHAAPELHFLTVREKRRISSQELTQDLWERVYPALETFNRHGNEWRARLHVRRGRPDEQIAQLAAEIRADLIVIGQFGLHNPKPTDRNVPNRILQAAVCPTLVVGMPEAADLSPQCPTCVAIREDSEGQHWFCAAHSESNRTEHDMTPMTTWSRGSLVYG
jgi:nucleotide-binding universal stress UspA family protein